MALRVPHELDASILTRPGIRMINAPLICAWQGGRLVSGLETDASGNVSALTVRDTATGQEERMEADAVVFAISIAGGPLLQAGRRAGGVAAPGRQAMLCSLPASLQTAVQPLLPSHQHCLHVCMNHFALHGCTLHCHLPACATWQACSGWCRGRQRWRSGASSRTS